MLGVKISDRYYETIITIYALANGHTINSKYCRKHQGFKFKCHNIGLKLGNN